MKKLVAMLMTMALAVVLGFSNVGCTKKDDKPAPAKDAPAPAKDAPAKDKDAPAKDAPAKDAPAKDKKEK